MSPSTLLTGPCAGTNRRTGSSAEVEQGAVAVSRGAGTSSSNDGSVERGRRTSLVARGRLHELGVGFYREREEGAHQGESWRPPLMAPTVSPSKEREWRGRGRGESVGEETRSRGGSARVGRARMPKHQGATVVRRLRGRATER